MKLKKKKGEEKTENLERDSLLKFLKTKNNGSEQTSVEHDTLKICEQGITNFLCNGDLITDLNNKNKQANYLH